jgi:hypothetical protein
MSVHGDSTPFLKFTDSSHLGMPMESELSRTTPADFRSTPFHILENISRRRTAQHAEEVLAKEVLITDRMIRRSTFHSAAELETAIYRWLASWNGKPAPFHCSSSPW